MGSAVPNILIGGLLGGVGLPLASGLALYAISPAGNGQAGMGYACVGLVALLIGVGVGGGCGLLICRGKGAIEESGYLVVPFGVALVVSTLVLMLIVMMLTWL